MKTLLIAVSALALSACASKEIARTFADEPFVEAKEVIGGYAIMEFRNKEEALASAVEFMQLHRQHMPGWEGTCEVRAMAGPEDTGCQAGQVDALVVDLPTAFHYCS